MNECWHILVVDDQKRTRESVKALLQAALEGAVILEAGTGREAVRLAGEERPDLVVMDVRMPEMDGTEAARAIKARWPNMGVVMLSMYPGYRGESLAAGADAFVCKGEPPETLLAAVQELLPGGEPCRS